MAEVTDLSPIERRKQLIKVMMSEDLTVTSNNLNSIVSMDDDLDYVDHVDGDDYDYTPIKSSPRSQPKQVKR
jgi:hypothetical protein